MPKRGFSTFRRDDEESTAAAGENPGTPSNGSSTNGAAHRGSDPPAQVQATSPEERQDGFFDREADTNEFTMPDLAPSLDEPEPDDFKPEGIVVSGPAAPPEEVTANAAATAPPERRQEPKKRVTRHEWQVDDGSEDDSDAFVPASEPTTPEPPDAERDGAPATKQVESLPPDPPAAAAEPVPPADTNERIRAAELAGAQVAEQQAVEEINALEEDLERAKREGEARAEELEAKLTEAERRASEAEERATVAPDAAQALEEQARNGAANWLRDQVRQIERSADRRVKAGAKDGGDREKLDAESEAEVERRLRGEADQRVQAETADLRRELDSLRAGLDERVREAEERTKLEVEAARKAAHERYGAELRARDEELDAERKDKARVIESSDRRLQEIEQRALAATDRVAAAERELADEADRLRANQEKRIEAEAEKARTAATKAADERVEREVAAAIATSGTEAREALRSREQELIRERSAIEGELAATKRRLDEAHERAVAAERRATEVEIEARREIERERETRFEEIEGRIAQVVERAGSAAGEIAPPDWVMEAPAQPAVEPEAAVEPEPEPQPAPAPEAETEAAPASDGMLSLSSASFDELRETGMSVTQAKRVIRHRDEHGGFSTVDELEQVPGFPKAFLADVKSRVVP